MDTLDGLVARHRHETSLLGSVLDIMVDRSVELVVLRVVYAHLRLTPVAIPLIFVVRGVVVDTLRNTQVSAGRSPFQTMATPWGKFLVASPLMRTSYAVVKLLAFAPGGHLAVSDYNGAGAPLALTLRAIFGTLSWVAAALCLARGLPVIVEAVVRLSAPEEPREMGRKPLVHTTTVRLGLALSRLLPPHLAYWLARALARLIRAFKLRQFAVLRANLAHLPLQGTGAELDALAGVQLRWPCEATMRRCGPCLVRRRQQACRSPRANCQLRPCQDGKGVGPADGGRAAHEQL